MNIRKWWYEGRIKNYKNAISEYEKALKKITPKTKKVKIAGIIYFEPYKEQQYIKEDLRRFKKELKKNQKALEKVM